MLMMTYTSAIDEGMFSSTHFRSSSWENNKVVFSCWCWVFLFQEFMEKKKDHIACRTLVLCFTLDRSDCWITEWYLWKYNCITCHRFYPHRDDSLEKSSWKMRMLRTVIKLKLKLCFSHIGCLYRQMIIIIERVRVMLVRGMFYL